MFDFLYKRKQKEWIRTGFVKFVSLSPRQILEYKIVLNKNADPPLRIVKEEDAEKTKADMMEYLKGKLHTVCAVSDVEILDLWEVLGAKKFNLFGLVMGVPRKPKQKMLLQIIEELVKANEIYKNNVQTSQTPYDTFYVDERLWNYRPQGYSIQVKKS